MIYPQAISYAVHNTTLQDRSADRRSNGRNSIKARVIFAPIWPLVKERVGALPLEEWVMRNLANYFFPLTDGSYRRAGELEDQPLHIDFANLDLLQSKKLEPGIREIGRALGETILSLHNETAGSLLPCGANLPTLKAWQAIRHVVLGGGLLQGNIGSIVLETARNAVRKEGIKIYLAARLNGMSEFFGAGYLIQDYLQRNPHPASHLNFATICVGGTSFKSSYGTFSLLTNEAKIDWESVKISERPRWTPYIWRELSEGKGGFSISDLQEIRSIIFDRMANPIEQAVDKRDKPSIIIVSTPGILSGKLPEEERKIIFGATIHFPTLPNELDNLNPALEISTRLLKKGIATNTTVFLTENDAVLSAHGLRKLSFVKELLANRNKVGSILVGSGVAASILAPA